MARRTYQAVCMSCYTCVIATSTRKKDVEIAAVSHMNLYKHNVVISEPLRVPVPEGGR